MDFNMMTNNAICKELGNRLKTMRLQENMTQKILSEKTGLSETTIKHAEQGRTKLLSLILILREFNMLDELNNFIQPTTISPLQLAKLQGKQPKRARRR
jgi:putative transcriptional regulator